MIRNTGYKKALVPENMYKRFSKKGNPEGTGLGLSIIYQICQVNKLDLQYYYESNFHVFRIDFTENIDGYHEMDRPVRDQKFIRLAVVIKRLILTTRPKFFMFHLIRF